MIVAPRNRRTNQTWDPDDAGGLRLGDLRLVTIGEYHRLIKIGFFTPNDRIELLDGLLVRKMPQEDPHAVIVSLLPDLFVAVLPADWTVRSQLPVTLAGDNEPEPDAVVCVGPKKRYRTGHPTGKDFEIVVEVVDATLRRDRTNKLQIYARNRIPAYWIVNVRAETVEVYSEPRAGQTPTYRRQENYPRGTQVPVVLRGEKVAEIKVDDLFE